MQCAELFLDVFELTESSLLTESDIVIYTLTLGLPTLFVMSKSAIRVVAVALSEMSALRQLALYNLMEIGAKSAF